MNNTNNHLEDKRSEQPRPAPEQHQPKGGPDAGDDSAKLVVQQESIKNNDRDLDADSKHTGKPEQ